VTAAPRATQFVKFESIAIRFVETFVTSMANLPEALSPIKPSCVIPATSNFDGTPHDPVAHQIVFAGL
jgi:hypothetical protein